MLTPKVSSIQEARAALDDMKPRSAWKRGVRMYAYEMLDDVETAIRNHYTTLEELAQPRALRTLLLNGAQDWNQFSEGGCALIYDSDIAERLCNPSELKKTRNGERRPNSREDWLDVQARALFQAANMVCRALFC